MYHNYTKAKYSAVSINIFNKCFEIALHFKWQNFILLFCPVYETQYFILSLLLKH